MTAREGLEPAVRAEALYQKGLVLEDATRYEDALTVFGSVTKDVPGVPAAPYALLSIARVRAKQGRIDEAIAGYDALIMAHPRFGGTALLARGRLDQDRGRTESASASYRLLLRSFATAPEAADARRALDRLCTGLLAGVAVATRYEDVLARGECLLDQERWREAQALYDRALTLRRPAEQEAELLMALGSAYDAQEKTAQAAAPYRRVMRLVPGTLRAAAAQMAIVQGHLDRGRWRDAIRELERVARAFPGTPQAAQAQFTIGTCQESLKDRRRAEEAYRKVIETAPQSAWAAESQQRLMRLLEQPR